MSFQEFRVSQSATPITACEASPFSQTSSLILYANTTHLRVAEITNKEQFTLEQVFEVPHSSSVYSLSWSPQSTSRDDVHFCMATASHNLSYYSMSSADDGEIRYSTLKGHRDFINQTAVNGLAPSQVASVSDDHTCRLWDLNSGACAAVFRLKAPGTALAWNPASPNELLVAERTGDLKLLDARSGACLRLMHIEECPLNSVDWSPKDPLWIGAVSGGRWTAMQLMSRPVCEDCGHTQALQALQCPYCGSDGLALPPPRIHSNRAQPEGSTSFRWARNHNLFSTLSVTGALSIWDLSKKQDSGAFLPAYSRPLSRSGGVSWLADEPTCVVATLGDLHFVSCRSNVALPKYK